MGCILIITQSRILFLAAFERTKNNLKVWIHFLVSRNSYNRRLEGKTDIHRENLQTPMISDWYPTNNTFNLTLLQLNTRIIKTRL